MSWKHRLSNINATKRTALCAVDGLVGLKNKKGVWVCKVAERQWDKPFRERYNTIEKRQHLHSLMKKSRNIAKLKVFKHYSKGIIKCVCCGEKETDFLTLDHTNNDGAKHRKILGRNFSGSVFYSWLISHNFPKGFQVMCFNCNLGKNINKGICPHHK